MNALSLVGYQLRLAWRSLGRDRFSTAVAVACVAISVASFGVAFIGSDLHARRPPVELQRRLFSVQIGMEPAQKPPDHRVDQPEMRPTPSLLPASAHALLDATPVPVRHFGVLAGKVFLRHGGRELRLRAWFVDADFFPLLGFSFERGGVWSGSAGNEVVLSHALARRLFGRVAPGEARPTIQGLPHRVAGVLAPHEVRPRFYDVAGYVEDEGDLFFPFPHHRTLNVRPDSLVAPRSVGPAFEDLWASEARYIGHWVELPEAQVRAAYERDLAERVCPAQRARLGDRSCWILPLDRWIYLFFGVPGSAAFILMIALALLGASALGLVRLLLARFLVRSGETAVQRALGASRRLVFLRLVLEGQLIALAGGVLGVALMHLLVPLLGVALESYRFRWWVPASAMVLAIVAAMAAGLAASIYPALHVGHTPIGRLLRRR